jgi:hypothetical protein
MRHFWLSSAVLLVVLTAVIIRQTQHELNLQAVTSIGGITLYNKAF